MLIDKLVKQVNTLQLNLRGKTVLTEAASGSYIVTPVLAAIAGAKVFAFSKTTRFGKVEDIFTATKTLAGLFKEYPLDIHFIEKLSPEIISQSDIITNSGHLRPLNEAILKHAKNEVVVPLMFEAWEQREADMDIQYIRKRGFKIAATNERHPDVDVFNYLGDMAIKQIFDAGTTPYRNKFILICNNDFGPFIAKTLATVCESLGVIDKNENRQFYNTQIDWIGGFPDLKIPPSYRDAEAVIFTAYPFDQNWIGENTPVSIEQIQSQFSNPYLLRYAGDIDEKLFLKKGIRFFPEHVHSGHMGVLPSAIGYDPIIRLQSGGLKVAELMIKNETKFRETTLVELIH